jgi:hypothetical protein
VGATGPHNPGHWPPPAISLAPKGNIEWLPNLQILNEIIGEVIGRRSSRDQWMNWHQLLTDGTDLPSVWRRFTGYQK